MKVYELMNELSELPGGRDVRVNICITTEELKDGDEITDGLYSRTFDVVCVEENGVIGTDI